MKRIVISLMWANLCFGITPIQHRPKLSVELHLTLKPEFQTPISHIEINSLGTYQITIPGSYYLTNDLLFYPGPMPTASKVIQISSDNVTLNLNGYEIRQDSTNLTPLVCGVIIDPETANVIVHNGKIDSMSGASIVVGENCKNITLHKLSVTNSGLAGIVIGYNPFDTSLYSTVFNGQEQIRYTDPANPTTNVTEDVLIDSVYLSGTNGYFHGTATNYAHAIGIQLVDVKNFQIINTLSNSNHYNAPDIVKNSTTNPGGYYVAIRDGYMGCGVHMIRCNNGYLEECEASNNQGWCAYGMLLETCSGISMQNCFANYTNADGDPVEYATLLPSTFNFFNHRDLGRAAGFMHHDSSGNQYVCCQAEYTNGNRQAAGFWFQRYYMITSYYISPTTTPIPNSQYFDPNFIPPQLNLMCTSDTTSLELTQAFLLPQIPSTIPALGSLYSTTTTPLYIQNAGSNWNECIECQSTHTSSTYLSAYGFLAEGSENNTFARCLSQNSSSGIGPDANSTYLSSALGSFDEGVGIYSLFEAPKYQSPITNIMIEYAVGICMQAYRLPLMQYNATTLLFELQLDISSNPIFLGMEIKSSPATYALPYWSENASYADTCESIDNIGSCVGTGVGILLNGAYKCILEHNWMTNNHSCTTGTTAYPCPSGGSINNLGAQGGYGILDLWVNSTSLIFDNKAFGNQTIRPLVVNCTGCYPTSPGLGAYVEGANYHVTYTDPNLALPVETASIGDFSAFNILTPYSNLQWLINSVNPAYLLLNRILISSPSAPAVFTI